MVSNQQNTEVDQPVQSHNHAQQPMHLQPQTCVQEHYYAVVTPLRKAASYEQRKTNLGNQNFRRRIIT